MSVKIVTTTGFEIEFDKNVLNNMEVVDTLVELENGNILAVSKMCSLLFSPEEKKRLYEHVREENGRVPLEKIDKEINEIITLTGNEGKN